MVKKGPTQVICDKSIRIQQGTIQITESMMICSNSDHLLDKLQIQTP